MVIDSALVDIQFILFIKSDLDTIYLKNRVTVSQLIQSQFKVASLSAQPIEENFDLILLMGRLQVTNTLLRSFANFNCNHPSLFAGIHARYSGIKNRSLQIKLSFNGRYGNLDN